MPIQKPIITELRYVNGQPDTSQRPDQARIAWAKDGESITGASGDTVSDGVLNRAPVQIQENVLNTHNNTKSQQTCIEELVDTVNLLTGGGDADLGTRVADAEYDIEVLQGQMTSVKADVGVASSSDNLATGLHRSVEDVENDIGVRNPSDIPNSIENNDTVRKDLYFIKRRIGNDRNYDVNGNSNPGAEPTGMKYQITDLYNRTATINTEIGENAVPGTINGRIYELEQNSQVGDVTQLREELGAEADAIEGRSVYLRLENLETSSDEMQIDINTINTTLYAPTDGLVTKVSDINSSINTIQIQAEANREAIVEIESDLGEYAQGDTGDGAVKERISSQAAHIDLLWDRVGTTDAATGSLGFRITALEDSLGNRNNPVEFTAWSEIQQNAGDIAEIKQDIGLLDTSKEDIEERLVALEKTKSYALLMSETPESVDFTTDFVNIFDIVEEEAQLSNFTYVNGVLTRLNSEYSKIMTLAWVMYEPDGVDKTITIRVEVTHPDTSSSFSDYTRKIRANTVTPVTVTETLELQEGTEVRIYAKTDSATTLEHDSLFVQI